MWHTVAIDYNVTDSECKMYFDGTLVDTYEIVTSQNLTGVPKRWTFGGTMANADNHVYINDLIIYEGGYVVPPATQAPVTQAPATQAPATQAPATQAPATQAPATQAPATQAPATQAPATQAPATQAPATQAPATQAPATQAPATQAPATQAPATQAPATQAPATQAPATPTPATQAPATQAPATPTPVPTLKPATVKGTNIFKYFFGTGDTDWTGGSAYEAIADGSTVSANGAVLTAAGDNIVKITGENTYLNKVAWGSSASTSVATLEFDYYTTNTWDDFRIVPAGKNRVGLEFKNDGNDTLVLVNVVGNTWNRTETSVTIPRYSWYRVAMEYNMPAGTMKVYIDGELVATQSTGLTTTDNVPVDWIVYATTTNGDTYLNNIQMYEGAYQPDPSTDFALAVDTAEVGADGALTVTLDVANIINAGAGNETFTVYLVEKDSSGRLINITQTEVDENGNPTLTLPDYNAASNYVMYAWNPLMKPVIASSGVSAE